MTTEAMVSIALSIFSVLIAGFALGWNVYRDVYSKPRIKVRAAKRVIVHGEQKHGPYLALDVTNFGPGTASITAIITRDYSPWLRPRNRLGGVVMHDWKNPYSAKLPAKLEPAERIDLFLPWIDEDKYVLSTTMSRLGVMDVFGRSIWVPMKDLNEVRQQHGKDFNK